MHNLPFKNIPSPELHRDALKIRSSCICKCFLKMWGYRGFLVVFVLLPLSIVFLFWLLSKDANIMSYQAVAKYYEFHRWIIIGALARKFFFTG